MIIKQAIKRRDALFKLLVFDEWHWIIDQNIPHGKRHLLIRRYVFSWLEKIPIPVYKHVARACRSDNIR